MFFEIRELSWVRVGLDIGSISLPSGLIGLGGVHRSFDCP